MAGLSIEINDLPVANLLQALLRSSRNTGQVMDQIGSSLVDLIKLQFTDQQSPHGDRWPPLSTVTRMRRRGGGGQPLLDTGRMRASITHIASDTDAVIGTNVRYAGTHQYGARKGAFGTGKQKTRNRTFPIPWGDVPARPFLPILGNRVDFPAEYESTIEQILLNHFSVPA